MYVSLLFNEQNMAKVKEEKQGIDAIIAAAEKKYSMDRAEVKDMVVVPSGSYTLDKATGIGGIPLRKVIEIWGDFSSGKSTLVLHITVQFQKAFPDKRVALFDYENAFDKEYAIKLGVDVTKLLIYQPNNQEVGYDLILELIDKDACSLIIIDSHTSATPQKIIDGDMTDATMGLQARNNSKFLAKVKGLLNEHNCTLVAISQTRVNIGGMGDVNVPTGGNGWKFYADMRFKLWKSVDKKESLNKTTLDVVKNKCAAPFGKAEFNIDWGKGIDNMQEILDLAIEMNIIKQSGSWYSMGEMKLGQGSNGVKEMFCENVELYEEIKNKVLV